MSDSPRFAAPPGPSGPSGETHAGTPPSPSPQGFGVPLPHTGAPSPAGAPRSSQPSGSWPAAHFAPGWDERALGSLHAPRPVAGTEPWAIAALITAVVLAPVGLVLSIVALARVKKSRRRGRKMAIVALILSLILLAIGGYVVANASSISRSVLGEAKPLPPDVSDSETVYALQLRPGNCLATIPSSASASKFDVVPCANTHAAAPWPGQDAVQARVSTSCALTKSEWERGLSLVALSPTENGWSSGDRTGLCVAHDPKGALTASLLG